VAAVAVVVLAGCSGQGQESAGPSGPTGATTASATSADPSASLEAEKARVVAAYNAYEQALVRLLAGGKADPKVLDGTATAEAARHSAQQASVLFSIGRRMVGTLSSTPRSVQISGDTAVLITCSDTSKWFGVDAGTTPTPGQTGRAPSLARVQLKRDSQGRWLFAHTEVAGTC
jgi:hypothetical protein